MSDSEGHFKARSTGPDSAATDDGPGGSAGGALNVDFDRFWVPEAIPAATVIVLRDGPSGLETLMLRRDGKLAFAGGMWVFPGGRLDPADWSPDIAGDGAAEAAPVPLEEASRAAAIRETTEETGLVLDPSRLVRWSHWTAPVQTPRRFTTAFYVADLNRSDAEVTIDNGEIRDFVWHRPSDVMERRDSGELGLTPPTYITLTQLVDFTDAASVVESAATRPVEHFETHFDFVGETMVAMYHGDAGYESSSAGEPGPRHRLTMDAIWRYERDV